MAQGVVPTVGERAARELEYKRLVDEGGALARELSARIFDDWRQPWKDGTPGGAQLEALRSLVEGLRELNGRRVPE